LSSIFLDGIFVCFGLEDIHQDFKVYGQTRIPAGRYKIAVRQFGGFHERYLKKYDFHRGMLQIMSVPGFEDALIHIGNFAKNTEGCLLVGNGMSREKDDKIMLTDSTGAYTMLYNKVIDKALVGDLEILIVDNDIY